MLSLSQVSLHIAISAFVESKRLISSAFLLTRDRQLTTITLRLRAGLIGGGFVRAGATGEEAAFGCPKLSLSVVGELEDSDENGLVCSDIVVESKNDDEKFGMPQPQHCHETFLNASLVKPDVQY